MPVILHALSNCDVCLETYGTNITPHAIPCGHVFCEPCLENVNPANCPLCRRPFLQDRIKKLHVDLPEPDVEREWLERVVLAFGSADSDDKAQLTTEIEEWLSQRPEDDHATLRKMWDAFNEHIRFFQKRRQDKLTIKQYQLELRKKNEENVQVQDTAKAVEDSLLTQISELSAQITDLKSQVDPLRAELSRFQQQNSHNPLPAPPQPVDLDRFPPFARAAAESSEGFVAILNSGGPPLFPNSAAAKRTRADKGKGRQPPESPPSPREPYSPKAPINTTGNVIIPGATISQRVIPSPDFIPGHAYITQIPASAYVNGYASGYDQGYSAASTGGAAAPNHASTSAHRLLSDIVQEHDDSLEHAMGGLQLWGVRAAAASAAIAPAASRPQEPVATVRHSGRRPVYAAPSHSSDGTSFLPSHATGPYSAPGTSSGASQASTSHSRPSALRRRTVQVDSQLNNAEGSASSMPHPPPLYAPARHAPSEVRFVTPATEDRPSANDVSARRTQQQNRADRRSFSSWGTVASNGSNSPTGTQRSLSVLGDLLNFPHAGARGGHSGDQVILDRGLVTTPRPEHEGLPLGFTRGAPAPTRPSHGHTYSMPANGLPTLHEAPQSYALQSNYTNNLYRTTPQPFSQPPTSGSELGLVMLPTQQQATQNALGLELGQEAAQMNTITAPRPRVDMAPYLNSWDLNIAPR